MRDVLLSARVPRMSIMHSMPFLLAIASRPVAIEFVISETLLKLRDACGVRHQHCGFAEGKIKSFRATLRMRHMANATFVRAAERGDA